MMKNVALILALVFALVISVALWFRDKGAVSRSAAQPWPEGMGTLDAARERWAPLKANDASAKMSALAKMLPKSEVTDDYVDHEIVRDELAIGEPPALPDVAAIRDLLLREAIVWERYDEIGDQNAVEMRTMQMRTARTLVGNALARARSNVPAAWDDLHAAWKLARSLDGHPQMMMQTAALSIARMINAIAWKMPLPAPAWLEELHSFDNLRRLLEAFQFQAESYRQSAWIFPTKWFARSIEHDRVIAEELSKMTRCDVHMRMNDIGTDLTPFWRRAFRFRAEREATANALRVRVGKAIETGSRCSDGLWSFDGTTLRFSREITTAPPDRPMPLALRLKP